MLHQNFYAYYVYQKAHALATFLQNTVEGHPDYLLFLTHCMEMSSKILRGEDVSYYVRWFNEWFETVQMFGILWNEEKSEWYDK